MHSCMAHLMKKCICPCHQASPLPLLAKCVTLRNHCLTFVNQAASGLNLLCSLEVLGLSLMCLWSHTLCQKPQQHIHSSTYLCGWCCFGRKWFNEIRAIKDFLHAKFWINDLSDLKFFLVLEVARSSEGILQNQRKYALELLEDSDLLALKPASTPMDGATRLSKDAGSPLTDVSSYRRLVGCLLYWTTMRPDITFSVQQLSQFMSCPMDVHHKATLGVL